MSTEDSPASAAKQVALPRDFRRLLIAWSSSLTGDGLRIVALPLMAHHINSSPEAVALVATFTSLPWLLVGVVAGALVDRMSPVRAIQLAHGARVLVSVALALGAMNSSLTVGLLCVGGFLLTSAETFADGAAQSMLVRVVPPAHLARANSRFAVVETVALDLLGPLVGGFTFNAADWLPFLLSAAGFAIAALVVNGLDGRIADRARAPAAPQSLPAAVTQVGAGPPAAQSLLASLRSGMARLFRDPVLRVLVLTVAVLAAANAAQDGVLVVFATARLGLSDRLYPTLLVAVSVGILIAAPLTGRLAARFGAGRLMVTSMVLMGSALTAMGLWPQAIVGWACYLLVGVATAWWNVLSATRRQARTPLSMAARVSSAFRVVAFGAIPLGNLVGGWVGGQWGTAAVFVGAGGVILVVAAIVGRSFFRAVSPSDTVLP